MTVQKIITRVKKTEENVRIAKSNNNFGSTLTAAATGTPKLLKRRQIHLVLWVGKCDMAPHAAQGRTIIQSVTKFRHIFYRM